MPGGRPTKYDPSYRELAYKFCLLGCTDERLAEFLDVHVDTIYEWKKVYPEFSEALKRGKAIADAEVAQSLYRRAMGYEHPEDKIFNDNGTPLVVPTTKHYPPDTAACLIWLKNRAGWRDRVEHTGADGGAIKTETKVLQVVGVGVEDVNPDT